MTHRFLYILGCSGPRCGVSIFHVPFITLKDLYQLYRKHGSFSYSHTFNCVCFSLLLIIFLRILLYFSQLYIMQLFIADAKIFFFDSQKLKKTTLKSSMLYYASFSTAQISPICPDS